MKLSRLLHRQQRTPNRWLGGSDNNHPNVRQFFCTQRISDRWGFKIEPDSTPSTGLFFHIKLLEHRGNMLLELRYCLGRRSRSPPHHLSELACKQSVAQFANLQLGWWWLVDSSFQIRAVGYGKGWHTSSSSLVLGLCHQNFWLQQAGPHDQYPDPLIRKEIIHTASFCFPTLGSFLPWQFRPVPDEYKMHLAPNCRFPKRSHCHWPIQTFDTKRLDYFGKNRGNLIFLGRIMPAKPITSLTIALSCGRFSVACRTPSHQVHRGRRQQ